MRETKKTLDGVDALDYCIIHHFIRGKHKDTKVTNEHLAHLSSPDNFSSRIFLGGCSDMSCCVSSFHNSQLPGNRKWLGHKTAAPEWELTPVYIVWNVCLI